jgi:hypothetical protein
MSAVAVLSALAVFDSLFNYFWSGNGIHGTEGALLVVISTFLMLIAAVLIAARWIRGGLRAVFDVLIVLDFAGTILAGWLLEAWILVALVVLAALAWLIHLFRPTPRPVPIG